MTMKEVDPHSYMYAYECTLNCMKLAKQHYCLSVLSLTGKKDAIVQKNHKCEQMCTFYIEHSTENSRIYYITDDFNGT